MEMKYHAYSPEYHLPAIESILKNASEFKDNFKEQLKNPALSDEQYGETFYKSVFVEASYSHMAASSLTSFFESLFFHEFYNLQHGIDFLSPINDSVRWKLESKKFWNPKKVAKDDGSLKNKDNFIEGVQQLFKALEIPFTIPSIDWFKIKTLFHYRNFISHNGFEWRKEKIIEFNQLIGSFNGENNFKKATSGKEIWIFYMTDTFVNDLIELAFQCTHNFDTWFWERIEKNEDQVLSPEEFQNWLNKNTN